LLIIIEGVDLTGKSTLAAKLEASIPRSYVYHAGPPTKHPLEEYETALADYDPMSDETLIIDRWHIGETVWPRIFGRKTAMDLATFRHVDMFLESRGALIVYAERDDEVLKNELVAANEPLHPDDLDYACRLFEGSLLEMTCPYLRYDYEEDGDDVAEIIDTAAYAQEYARDATVETLDIIGASKPILLLVGDRWGPEHKDRNPPPVPFAPYTGTSGHYLMSALPRNLRAKIAIVNAYSGREPNLNAQELGEIHRDLGEPHVVALGRKAQEACTNAGLYAHHVPHPQYWRRFNYSKMPEYTDLIKGALKT
jgi:hypothetical protein